MQRVRAYTHLVQRPHAAQDGHVAVQHDHQAALARGNDLFHAQQVERAGGRPIDGAIQGRGVAWEGTYARARGWTGRQAGWCGHTGPPRSGRAGSWCCLGAQAHEEGGREPGGSFRCVVGAPSLSVNACAGRWDRGAHSDAQGGRAAVPHHGASEQGAGGKREKEIEQWTAHGRAPDGQRPPKQRMAARPHVAGDMETCAHAQVGRSSCTCVTAGTQRAHKKALVQSIARLCRGPMG